MKKIKYFLTFITLFMISNNLVLANNNGNTINFDKHGSITITLKESTDNTLIEGAEITIYKIAIATSIDNNLKLIYNENIKDCESDLSNLSDELLASKLSECIINKEISSQTKLTNELGIVNFDNLDLGLYLINQTNNVDGYSSIDPFLIMIPKVENNKWVYDIEANPKTNIIKLFDITVEKRWDNINRENTPKEVTIQLLKQNKVIATITLNKENNWSYTWNQMEKSDDYQVLEINIPTGYTATYRQVENKFIVTNTKTLVQTGQNILLIELLAASGFIFLLVGIILKRKKHE